MSWRDRSRSTKRITQRARTRIVSYSRKSPLQSKLWTCSRLRVRRTRKLMPKLWLNMRLTWRPKPHNWPKLRSKPARSNSWRPRSNSSKNSLNRAKLTAKEVSKRSRKLKNSSSKTPRSSTSKKTWTKRQECTSKKLWSWKWTSEIWKRPNLMLS